MKKYIVTITLGIIAFIISYAFLSVMLSYWSGAEFWEEFTVFYLSPIYHLLLGFWIFKQKGRRGKHVGIFVVTFTVSWCFFISQELFREYHIKQIELNYPTVAIIKNKEDSDIHYLNLREVYYRYSNDTVSVSFEPDNGYTEKDINLIINWLPTSKNEYIVVIDATPNSIEPFTGSTYLKLNSDKEVMYCKSDYENMCDAFIMSDLKDVFHPL
ncbi:hypothetical protein [Paenibacillus amylolyticus]|uniref:hypothetical protein n=1 Tax=Paenibacillus amylolyticus TaxID=1451 RepID=UPI0033994EC7